MNIMMLSWEFPPRIVGGISPHVYNLSEELAKLGEEVSVITCDYPGAPEFEDINGVHVYRVDSYKSPTTDFESWVYLMNVNMQIKAAKIIGLGKEKVDIIHAHDWLVATSSVSLKHIYRKPLVTTIHSTEYGRRNGIYNDYQRNIHGAEVWLAHEGWRVICCSDYMASEVSYDLGLPRSNIDVIPNGIDINEFTEPYDRNNFRNQFANNDEKLILFVGRLVHEKGVLTLIEAARRVLQNVNAKFIIAGTGYLWDEIMRRTIQMGISNKVYLTGFIDDAKLRLLYRTADVCVVPSLYEPFGIVALEAMAAKTPVVVSGVGGLSEVVENDLTGVVVYPDNPDSLAWGITKVLKDKGYSDWLRANAFKAVAEVYNWRSIGKRTLSFYKRVLKEYQVENWKPTEKFEY